MKTFLPMLMISGWLATAMAAQDSAQAGGAIMSAARRVAVIKSAGDVLAAKAPTWRIQVADIPDPFFRPNADAAVKTELDAAAVSKGNGRSDEQILEAVASGINPTGTMLIGNEQYLLLSGRRFRVGDQISVTFEGSVYRLGISSIERNSYTLRLNDQELLRDFK